jgi:hypothetical protein
MRAEAEPPRRPETLSKSGESDSVESRPHPPLGAATLSTTRTWVRRALPGKYANGAITRTVRPWQ